MVKKQNQKNRELVIAIRTYLLGFQAGLREVISSCEQLSSPADLETRCNLILKLTEKRLRDLDQLSVDSPKELATILASYKCEIEDAVNDVTRKFGSPFDHLMTILE